MNTASHDTPTSEENVTASLRPDVKTLLRYANLTDTGNAERLVACYGHALRYDTARKEWFVWDGTRWSPDKKKWPMRFAKQTVRRFQRAVLEEPDEARKRQLMTYALKCEQRDKLAAMLELTQSEEGISVTPDELDADPWLLNVQNGTVDLRTGLLRAHQQRDLITKLAPVTFDPTARCPKWLAFLHRIMGGDERLIAYLQRVIGYCLTGSTAEQVFFIFYGDGANGKTTFVLVIKLLLGDYATDASITTFLRGRFDEAGGGAPREDLAHLVGSRFVPAGEIQAGAVLNEELVKRWSGGDALPVRHVFGKQFVYTPAGKLVLFVNERPEIKEGGHSMWRRTKPVPFEVTIPEKERIKDYHLILADELPGILNWAIEGCLAWQREGHLNEPTAVTKAGEDYRAEMDGFARWFAEEVATVEGVFTPTAELHTAYLAWGRVNEIRAPLNPISFGRSVKRATSGTAGIKADRSNKLKGWRGLALSARMSSAGSRAISGDLSIENPRVRNFTGPSGTSGTSGTGTAPDCPLFDLAVDHEAVERIMANPANFTAAERRWLDGEDDDR